MADATISTPVEGGDPCGEDLRWDMDFMAIMQQFDALVMGDTGGTVEGEAVASEDVAFRDLLRRIDRLCVRTKDVRLLAVRAEALWREEGLGAFAHAFEDLVVAAEQWPDPDTGLHPRADEDDGDLGERAAPLTKLLNATPTLAATIGWGASFPTAEEQQAATSALAGIFDAWTSRLEPAFGHDLPLRHDAWGAIGKLLPAAAPTPEGQDGAADVDIAGAPSGPVPADAWELVERAAELLAIQDRHSPALPVLQLLLIWRSRGILEIMEDMRESGLPMEQLLDSIRKQLPKE